MNRIPEIDSYEFKRLLDEIRDTIGKESRQEKDVFLEIIRKKYPGRNLSGISQKLGYFHQNLMGSFHGWTSVYNGKGFDLISDDGQTIVEVKNKYNTMNADSKKSVIDKLTAFIEKGKTSILCFVNVKSKKKPELKDNPEIAVKSGKEMYTILSGRESFWDDLLQTFEELI
jgi:hypothetical protein